MRKSEGSLGFVVCVNDTDQLNKYLMDSECLRKQQYYQSIYFGATSAAMAFNSEMEKLPPFEWLVWVHQDVFLPDGWDNVFKTQIYQAMSKFPRLGVVGVYGVDNSGGHPLRAGHVLDRGTKLVEPSVLPCAVNSLDEMLVAVRTDSCLLFDPALGFDFYATDMALTAIQRGFDVVVVDAYCEHWSQTIRNDSHQSLIKRIVASAEIFEHKWQKQFPLETPCFAIAQLGCVARQCESILK